MRERGEWTVTVLGEEDNKKTVKSYEIEIQLYILLQATIALRRPQDRPTRRPGRPGGVDDLPANNQS